MLRNNILLLASAWMVLTAGQSICQTAATHLATIPLTGGAMSTPGTYYLGWDITGDVTINTSNVILDLNGHLVKGSISIAQGASNVTIMNGCITHNSNTPTISADTCSDIKLNAITVRNSVGSGITITDSTNVIMKEVNCYGPSSSNSCGIELDACSNARITQCLCCTWNTGIAVIGSSQYIVIEKCHVSGTTQGLYFVESTNTTVLNCTSFSNNKGFLFENDSSIEVSNCIADGNQSQGFDTTAASDVYLTECLAFGNTDNGFRLKDGNNQNFASKCVALSNGTGFFDNSNNVNSTVYTSNYANANSDNYNTNDAFKDKSANRNDSNFWNSAVKTNTGLNHACDFP